MEQFDSNSFKAGWLRGFFDGEGSASLRAGNKDYRHATYCLSVTNTDFGLMDICQSYLTSLGIEWREWNVRVRQNRKPARTLHISRAASIRAFHLKVGFGASKKRETLDRIINWIDRPSVDEARLPDVIRLWDAGHSLRCITRQLGLRPGHHSRLKNVLSIYVTVPAFGKGRKRCFCDH